MKTKAEMEWNSDRGSHKEIMDDRDAHDREKV